MLTLQTWRCEGTPDGESVPVYQVREIPHLQPQDINDALIEQLVEREQWDYEQHGVTRTYLVVGAGLVPLEIVKLPEADDDMPDSLREPFEDQPEMGSHDAPEEP